MMVYANYFGTNPRATEEATSRSTNKQRNTKARPSQLETTRNPRNRTMGRKVVGGTTTTTTTTITTIERMVVMAGEVVMRAGAPGIRDGGD